MVDLPVDLPVDLAVDLDSADLPDLETHLTINPKKFETLGDSFNKDSNGPTTD